MTHRVVKRRTQMVLFVSVRAACALDICVSSLFLVSAAKADSTVGVITITMLCAVMDVCAVVIAVPGCTALPCWGRCSVSRCVIDLGWFTY